MDSVRCLPNRYNHIQASVVIFVQNGQTTVAGVEYTNGTGLKGERWDHGSIAI